MKWQRKKVLINKSLQLKYGFYAAIAMVGIMFLTILNTYLDMISLINSVLPQKGRSYILFWDLITPFLFIKILLITVVIILLGVLLNHRFAGPIYRFNHIFKKIARGELDMDEVKLRQDDELKDEAGELSAMIKTLKGSISSLKKDIDTLSSEDKLTSPEARPIIARIKEKLSFFKTD